MAPSVRHTVHRGLRFPRQRKAPRDRSDPEKVFYFPGEVVRILKLTGIDYHQLRRLFRLLAATPLPPPSKERWNWSRYSFRDLVALRTAVRLAQRSSGRRDFRSVEEACRVLRGVFQVSSPLTQVQLERLGDTILARIDGMVFEVRTGQRVIAEVADQVLAYVQDNCHRLGEERACMLQVRVQAQQLRHSQRRRSRRVVAAVTGRRPA